jgi:hypothetical protein
VLGFSPRFYGTELFRPRRSTFFFGVREMNDIREVSLSVQNEWSGLSSLNKSAITRFFSFFFPFFLCYFFNFANCVIEWILAVPAPMQNFEVFFFLYFLLSSRLEIHSNR